MCNDKTVEVISDLNKTFDIKSLDVSNTSENPQIKVYKHAYEEYNHEIDWMAFIDGDEFLFSPKSTQIQSILEKYSYERLSALGVHWACYGSSNHIEEPKGLIIQNFNYRAELQDHKNKHVKSLVIGRQGTTVNAHNPHYFQTQYGTFDENLRPLKAGISEYEATHSYLRINHYVTQSYNYYFEKKAKYARPDNGEMRNNKFWEEHNQNDIQDKSSRQNVIDVLKSSLSRDGNDNNLLYYIIYLCYGNDLYSILNHYYNASSSSSSSSSLLSQ